MHFTFYFFRSGGSHSPHASLVTKQKDREQHKPMRWRERERNEWMGGLSPPQLAIFLFSWKGSPKTNHEPEKKKIPSSLAPGVVSFFFSTGFQLVFRLLSLRKQKSNDKQKINKNKNIVTGTLGNDLVLFNDDLVFFFFLIFFFGVKISWSKRMQSRTEKGNTTGMEPSSDPYES